MKKIVIILFFACSITFGQETQNLYGKNRTEIKFNLLTVSFKSIGFEFERTLNSNSSVGLSFEQTISIGQNSNVAAFYRHYFGKKYASGFFIEAFGMYHYKFKNETETFSFGTFESLVIKNDFAVGLGIGYKWVSKKGLVLQGNLGVGRNIFNGKKSYGELHPGKAGISIGYRF